MYGNMYGSMYAVGKVPEWIAPRDKLEQALLPTQRSYL